MVAAPTISVRERRKDIERWLDEAGVNWEYQGAFPLEDIDIEGSLANQARMHEPLNSATVDTYASAMERGDEFPSVIVVRPGASYLATAVDGNHRINAAVKAGAESVGAYVVKGDPSSARIITLTMEANARHGMPVSVPERLEQAVWLVANGSTQARAAAAVNVPLSSLKSRLNRERSHARGLDAGVRVSTWSSLSSAVRVKLAQVSTDEGLKAAANLAYSANLSAAEVNSLVELVNESRSGAKQQAAVKAFASQVGDRRSSSEATVGARSTAKQRFTLAVSNLLSLPDSLGPSLNRAFAAPERKSAAKQARAAAAKLIELAETLEK